MGGTSITAGCVSADRSSCGLDGAAKRSNACECSRSLNTAAFSFGMLRALEAADFCLTHFGCHTGLFYHLLRLTAYLYNVEYVVVDMSPSSSMFNRAILMSSDGFFMPSGVDPKVRGVSLLCHLEF